MTVHGDPAVGLEEQPEVIRRWLALVALLGATFLGTINNSIVNVAVPDMSQDLGVPISTTVWVVSGFVIALGTLMPLAGKVGDMYGPRRVFLWGTVLFAVASLVVAVGSNIGVVIAGRLLQGAAGAPVLPCILATISRLFGPDERGRAVAAWAAVNSAALAAGPAVGGLILDSMGWRAIFWLSAPAFLLVGVSVALLVPADPPSIPRRLDVAGAALVAIALVTLTLPITEGSAWGWTHPATLALAVLCGASLLVLRRHLLVTSEPFIDPVLIRQTGYLTVTGFASLQMIVLFAVTFSVPVYLVTSGETSAAMAGLLTSTLPAAMVVGAVVTGRVADRAPLDTLVLAGGIAMSIGVLALIAVIPGRAGVVLALVAIGVGISLIQTPAASAVTSLAPEGQTGLAAGVFNTARFVLGGLGATLAAVVFTTVGGGETGAESLITAVRMALLVALAPAVGVAVLAQLARARRLGLD